jgi:phospho-N-acetylmuramoyl-pentapeptide-transferase
MKAILIAGAFSLLGTLIGTRFAIPLLVAKGYGQLIRDDGPTSHHTKRGTPTMGGLVIILSVVCAYLVAKLATGYGPHGSGPSASALLLLFLFVGLGAIGFLDDYIKVAKDRSLGLRSKAKMIGQVVVGLIFAFLAIGWHDDTGRTPITHAISFTRDFSSWKLPTVLLIIWVLVLIAGASNGVNLTDGLDGLATGASVMVFGAFVLINIWQSNQNCSTNPGIKCYEVRDPRDLAVVAAALTGACFGFLWWNASPAKIFMGDTGSLSLGGAMAGFALMTRTELLLVVLGGLFVAITASVILQVGYFKISNGKRIFRMAPLQHHFELLGWEEITIVVRFWIISGLCVATGLGIFYAEWVSGA